MGVRPDDDRVTPTCLSQRDSHFFSNEKAYRGGSGAGKEAHVPRDMLDGALRYTPPTLPQASAEKPAPDPPACSSRLFASLLFPPPPNMRLGFSGSLRAGATDPLFFFFVCVLFARNAKAHAQSVLFISPSTRGRKRACDFRDSPFFPSEMSAQL